MLHFAPRYGLISPALIRPSQRDRLQAANDNRDAILPRSLFRKSPDGDFVPPTAPRARQGQPQDTLNGRMDRGCGAMGGTFETVPQAAMIGDARVQAALRLFATHGLAASARAACEAANANARGDDRDARWWHEISRML